MFILTQSGRLENSKNNIYRVQDTALEKEYQNAGYQRYERSYKIKESHKEYIVVCLEFRNDALGLEPVVILPEFLVPRRHYPIYVYLYAMDLYCGAPEKGQRWAAEETRKRFGLETFAHTTLGRALKALARSIGENARVPDEAENTATGAAPRESGFPNIQSTEASRKQVTGYLRGRLNQAERGQVASIGCELAREWFQKYRRFLL
jgi:hypothetical protein